MRVAVYGLWHLGCVTAACLAAVGHQVIGLDTDEATISRLRASQPPLFEPGLEELIADGVSAGRLTFTTDPNAALASAEVMWVTFDTPVNEYDEADVGFVREQLQRVVDAIRPGTLVLISSQVPVGFTSALERDWHARDLHFAYSPENLRLGKAIESFRRPERVIAGVRNQHAREKVQALFAPFCERFEWMSAESAEMTKHALNAFLATSVTFANEIARLCEVVGADAKEVERGLKSEGRIGSRAYLAPGAAFAGGTLARDLRFLARFGRDHQIATPLLNGVLDSNEQHKNWLRETVTRLLDGIDKPVVAVLGLTYKPGTSTLRRSAAIELCTWLAGRGIIVRAHDPAVQALPDELRDIMTLCTTPHAAIGDAHLAVVATEWPEYRSLTVDDFATVMSRPAVVDQNWFLAEALGADARITYVATGRSNRRL